MEDFDPLEMAVVIAKMDDMAEEANTELEGFISDNEVSAQVPVESLEAYKTLIMAQREFNKAFYMAFGVMNDAVESFEGQ